MVSEDTYSEPIEEMRRRELVEVTIDSLAEVGFVGTTLSQIAARAGVSPGLVAHYFDDKDGLLDAAFRSLARRVGSQVRARLRLVATPRGRIQAVIDANLAPEEFDQRTGSAWLAFWGQVLHVERLKRIQSVYQRRTLSTLRNSLLKLVAPDEAHSLAAMIAAMIDGVWLRAALSGWHEADSESARAMLTAFVDGRLSQSGRAVMAAVDPPPSSPAPGQRFASINPATGEILGQFTVSGAAQVNAAVAAAVHAQTIWAAMTGAERGRVLRRTADLLRSRNQELAELETKDTGKPIQETRVVDVASALNWTIVDRAFVDVWYDDPANDVSVQTSIEFTEEAKDTKSFRVALVDPDLRLVNYSVTVIFKTGEVKEIPPSATLKPRLLIRQDMTGHRIIAVRPDNVGFAGRKVKELVVDTRYVDDPNGLSFADSYTFRSPADAGSFEHDYVAGGPTGFEYRLHTRMTNNLVVEGEWTPYDGDELVLPVGR